MRYALSIHAGQSIVTTGHDTIDSAITAAQRDLMLYAGTYGLSALEYVAVSNLQPGEPVTAGSATYTIEDHAANYPACVGETVRLFEPAPTQLEGQMSF